MLSLALLHRPAPPQYGTLALNYKSLTVLDYVPPKFSNIERLYINHNKLKSLMGIQSFQNLKVLHIRFNHIRDFDELARVANPFFMESIAVTGNPMQFDRRCKEENAKALFKNLKQYNPPYSLERERQLIEEPRKSVGFRPEYQRSRQDSQIECFDTPIKSNTHSSRNKGFTPISDKRSPLIATKRMTPLYQQSTKRDSHPSPLRPSLQSKYPRSIPPFESALKPQFSITARFKPQYSLDEKSQITIDFINQENMYLSEAFYWRNLAEKCFGALKELRNEKGKRFYELRLKLKGFASLKASTMMRRVEREYSAGREHILQALSRNTS